MFRQQSPDHLKKFRYAVVGLLLLSIAALVVTIWFVVDFPREQEIVQRLIQDLPRADLEQAEELVGELKWQGRLTFLILLQVIATALAVIILWRAFQANQGSLRDIKALASDILSSMDQAIVTVDRTGTITSFNSQTTKLLGLAHDPFGQPLSELTDQIDLEAFRDTYNRSPARHASHDFLVQTHGRPIWLRTFCHPLRDAEGNVTGNVIQLRDVTSERHVEDQVRRMERFMGLGSLAVGLHHEIKNPLAAISLHAQLLEEQLASDPGADDVPGLLSVIRNEIQRVGAVLEGFRDFASTVKLERQEVNVRKMIEQQVELLRPQAERQQVEITRDYGEATPSMVYIDQTRIEQVLLNLLLNGIDAMQDGGQLRIETNRIDWESEPSLAIVVEDSGTGIPENIQDHIFDAYFTTKNSGTGMGLALSDKIVRQHGGRLEYTTGQTGTRFTMILPLSTDDAFTLSDN